MMFMLSSIITQSHAGISRARHICYALLVQLVSAERCELRNRYKSNHCLYLGPMLATQMCHTVHM